MIKIRRWERGKQEGEVQMEIYVCLPPRKQLLLFVHVCDKVTEASLMQLGVCVCVWLGRMDYKKMRNCINLGSVKQDLCDDFKQYIYFYVTLLQ